MLERLDSLLKLIFEYVYGETLSPEDFDSFAQSQLPQIAKGVAELSLIYTHQRHSVSGKLLMDPVLRKAYLAYFLPCLSVLPLTPGRRLKLKSTAYCDPSEES